MRPRLFWNVFTIEARKRMSYRADFWINSVAGILVNFSVFWFLTHALFEASGRSTLAGFTPRGMVLYYVFAILTGRIVQSNEMELGIAQDIYEGSLNRYLIYPVPYAAVKFAEQAGALAPQMVQMVLFGVVAPLMVGIPEEIHITPASVAMCLVSLALANLLHYLLIFPIHAVAFWADNVWSLMVAERFAISLLGGLLLPLSLFPDWVRAPLSWLPSRPSGASSQRWLDVGFGGAATCSTRGWGYDALSSVVRLFPAVFLQPRHGIPPRLLLPHWHGHRLEPGQSGLLLGSLPAHACSWRLDI
jgi:ABC-2 type transport system permease protein